MPNTKAGLKTADEVTSYIDAAKTHAERLGIGMHFIPTFQLTEATTMAMIDACADAEIMDAKVYPLFRTTQSNLGVSRYGNILTQVRRCGERGIRVHFHPENPSKEFGNRDAEYAFLPIMGIMLQETDASVVWEHGTDARCIPHWTEMAKSRRFAVTLTAHHLAANEDGTFGDVFAACKPPIKTEEDRKGLVGLVKADHVWVMAGADDAPHDIAGKHKFEGQCSCGAYTAPYLAALYAHALDDLLLDEPKGPEIFRRFTSENANAFFNRLNPGEDIVLERAEMEIPGVYRVGSWDVVPFWPKRKLSWRIADNAEA
jgi:dihydroorotase